MASAPEKTGGWKHLGAASLGLWGATALSFVTSVIAARSLGLESYGAVVVALASAGLVSGLLDVSLEEAVVHRGTRAIAEGDVAELRRVFRIAAFVDAFVGSLVAGLIYILAGAIADIAGAPDATDLIRIAALMVVATTVDGTSTSVILLARRTDLFGLLQLVSSGIQIAVVGGLALSGRATDVAVMWAYVIGALAGAATQILVARGLAQRQWPGRGAGGNWLREAGGLLRFGLHTSLSTTVTAASGSLVPLIVSSGSGQGAAAIFKIGQLPTVLASLASAPARAALLPEQARLAAAGDRAGLRRTIRTYAVGATGVAAAGVIAGWFLLPTILDLLYPTGAQDAVPVARIMLVPAAVMLIFGWAKAFPAAIGRPQIRTHTLLLVAAITVGGTLMFGGTAVDAAVASALAYLAYATVWIWLATRFLSSGDLLKPAAVPVETDDVARLEEAP